MLITILAITPYYLPGYKAGGPLRSLENLVEHLGDSFTFRIVTRDRDHGDPSAFPGIAAGEWYGVGKGRAVYLASAQLGPLGMRRVIASTGHDVLYLNSLYSPRFTQVPLLLRWLGLLPRRAVVLAPRGELHPGALAKGSWPRWVPAGLAARAGPPGYIKKRVYIALTRALGWYEGVTWQACNDEEAAQIRRYLGASAAVVVAPDLAAAPAPAAPPARRRKVPGTLRVVFLSRIDAKKNLAGAIMLLEGVRGRVVLDIYGPVDDPAYWARCRAALARLPANVSARYHGPVPHEWVADVFRTHDLFLFPTWGENYGHVVLEALAQGCPVLVSDRTHWRGLAHHTAGWDVDPDDTAAMGAVLQACVDMDEPEYARWSAGAASFARARSASADDVRSSRELFRTVSLAAVGAPAAVEAGP
jgi:glycosyltransferase involved in cell wall biosynthesis